MDQMSRTSLYFVFWTQNAANMHPTFDCSIVPGQPPPQALRFLQGRGERLVTNRKGPWVQTAGEGPSLPLSPSRLPLRAHFGRERDVWVRGRSQVIFISEPNDGHLTAKIEYTTKAVNTCLVPGPCWAQPMLFESRTSEKAWWTRRKRQYYTTTWELNLSLIISYVST